MKVWGRWLLRGGALAVVLVALLLIWRWPDVQRLWAVNQLFDADRIAQNFRQMDRLFLHQPIPMTDNSVSPLAVNPQPITGLEPWLTQRSVTGMVVLHQGAVVYETYGLGATAEDRHISWSVAKSWLSALLGVLIAEDYLSLDDSVSDYAPALAETAYANASVRDVLHMASGVAFDEDYFDPWSDINRMGRVLALGGSMDDFALLRQQLRPPGEAFQYVSIDTHVLSMVIRGATGRNIIELMGEYIVRPLGLASQPYYLTDGQGVAFVLGGLNMSTRDYARFGQLYAQQGMWQGRQIVPREWVLLSTQPSSPTAPGQTQYGLHWWLPADAAAGEYFARGVYGQYIYIDSRANVVIAVNAADRHFSEPGVLAATLAQFRAIVSQLDG